jgi:hypothetical protein
MAIASAVASTVGMAAASMGMEASVGWEDSLGAGACVTVAAPPHAASRKLMVAIMNINERTIFVMSILLLIFTLKSYQWRFKDKRRRS